MLQDAYDIPVGRKEKIHATKRAKKAQEAAILRQKKRKDSETATSDEDEELIPKSALKAEQRENSILKRRLKNLERQLAESRQREDEERKLRTALSWALLKKFGKSELNLIALIVTWTGRSCVLSVPISHSDSRKE